MPILSSFAAAACRALRVVGLGCGCSPSYVTGNRSGSITVTTNYAAWTDGSPSEWVDGITSNVSGCYISTDNTAVSGKYLEFSFGSASTKITEAKAYLQSGGAGSSVHKWQGWNGSSWEDIGGTFTFDQTQTVLTITTLSENAKGFTKYRMIGTSGVLRFYYINEFEFKQCAC